MMNIPNHEKQEILEEMELSKRLEKATVIINREIQRAELGEKIQSEVQDEISKHIALSLHQAFSSFSTQAVDPADYDLYLRASPSSYAPDELRTHIGLLEVVTQRAPDFAEAWGRLAYLRAWLSF